MPMMLRFLLVGFVNTAVGYGMILFFQFVFSLNYWEANAMGYVFGGLTSYFLNKSFTFKSKRADEEALPRFVLVAASCYVANLAILKIGISVWQLPVAISQGLAIFVYSMSFFFLSKWFVFRGKQKAL